MQAGLAFWIIALVAIVFGGVGAYRPAEPRWGLASWFVLFVLILLLGWRVFGPILQA